MNYTYKRTIAFFVQFLKPYKGIVILSFLLSFIASISALYNAFALSQIIDFVFKYSKGDSLSEIYSIIYVWLLVIIIRYASIFYSRSSAVFIAERAAMDTEIFSVNHISKIDISWHEKENSGNKIKRIERASRSIVEMVRLWRGTVVDIIVNFLGIVFIIYQFDSMLVLFIVVYQVIYYFIASATRERGIKAMLEANIKDEVITGFWYEIASNIRSIKVLGMATKIIEYARDKSEEYLVDVKRRIFWFQLGGVSEGTFEAFTRIFFIIYIIWGIVNGRYEPSFLVLFYSYFNTLSNSVGQLSDVAQDTATAKSNIGRLTEILDEPILIDDEKNKIDFPSNWNSIKIENLSFEYGKSKVLNNINIEIKKGEKLGIVGLSGAGKSTLFKLLLKEYENYEGSIMIGNASLKDINKKSYVQHIAAVLQETEVFNMSLHKNITIANSDQMENKNLFERSLDIAHIKDFLNKLPSGEETLIGEKGIKLSGGERQRLGIARAVFKNPEILFLDEATSHLDVESERKIQDTLKIFFKDVTAVVIAHRLSTIREMDRIIVLENGQIIEEGTFDELHSKESRFKEFWDKQKI
jgi:ABC-type multidrug transport system fused ATPase/permease subunit